MNPTNESIGRLSDDDLTVIIQDWSEYDPDQKVAIMLAREVQQLREQAMARELDRQAPGGGGEVQPFVTCRCHDERAKELCLDKHRCVRVSAHDLSPKEQGECVRHECRRVRIEMQAEIDRLRAAGAEDARDGGPLMAARETEDDGAAIMGRLARALAKADPTSRLPAMAIDWLRSQGIHWKSHCPTDPLHDFGEPMTGAGDHDDLPAFLAWVADELVRRDTRPGTFAHGVSESLKGRAYILRAAIASQAKEVES